MTSTWPRRLLGDGRARLGLLLIGFLVAAAVLSPLIAPYDPIEQLDIVNKRLLSPNLEHLMGTDFYSRDLLSRVLYGARISLAIAFLSILVSVTIGATVGMIAGYVGGVVDAILMRLVDAALAIPRVFLLLVILALWDRVGVTGLVTVLGLSSWFGTSRIVRAEVLSLRQRDFVVAARSLGVGKVRILLRHVLPNAIAPVTVTATLGIGQIILIEAGLSYLGVGVQEPIPSLGRMIRDGYEQIANAPWISIFPGLVIVLTVVGFSLVGDGLRKTLDPRAR
jgi:peptide/nickel transport system permease protein